MTQLEWWKADPHNELVERGTFCLADPGNPYVVYLPHGGEISVKVEPGKYEAQWFNPRTRDFSPETMSEGPKWISPSVANNEDWVMLLNGNSLALLPKSSDRGRTERQWARAGLRGPEIQES